MHELSTLSKKLLTEIFSNSLLNIKNTIESISQNVYLSDERMIKLCNLMKKGGLILESYGELKLTLLGRTKINVVLTGGVFDIIHPGHVFTLSSAKGLGDILVVVVARDSTVVNSKGHKPLNNEIQRLELVRALKFVDAALLGSEEGIFETLMKVMPNIVALGYDQKHDESELEREAKRRGLSIKFVRLGTRMASIKSSKIIEAKREFINDF